ncbi:MAG: ABC transporter ATP-binding protein [Sulfolobales archaeon]
MKYLLEVRDLRGGYIVDDRYLETVSGANLELRESEIFGIAGESGCGKSTLLKIIYGSPIVTLRSGSIKVRVNNQTIDISSMSLDDKKTKIWWSLISYIPQNNMSAFNPTQKIRDHIRETIKSHMKVDRHMINDMMNYIEDLAKSLGLSPVVLNAYPHQLSGGMRQRIAILMAIMLKPKIILADEPTTGLDVIVQRGILQQLVKIRNQYNVSLVLVSHDMSVHAMVSDRLAVMYAGKMVEVGSTRDMFENPLHPYTQALISSLPRIGDRGLRRGLHGMPPSLVSPPPGCRFHPRCPFAMDICRREEPPLIDLGGRLVSCWLHVRR